jgi:ATP-dependent helicase/nuclease subunit A
VSGPPSPPTSIAWSEAALALFDLAGPTAVRAGAGSGKTTALVELCVRLLAGETPGGPRAPHELVAITFTEKAAAELEERLRAALARRAAEAVGADAAAWRERLAALDGMAIGTIHAFCGRLLREHAVEAGLDPEFAVAEEERAAPWLAEASLGAVLAALDAGDDSAGALCAGLGAERGRGALAETVAGMVRERAWRADVAPAEPAPDREEEGRAVRAAMLDASAAILRASAEATTPTLRRAVEGLAEALGRLPPADRDGPLDAGAAARLAALPDSFKGTRRTRSGGTLFDLRDALKEAADRLPPLVADRLAGPQRRALAALVGEAERRYRERKRAERSVDFDDLLRLARDLLRDAAPLRAELRGRYRALLVDEYQDVNPVQQELFSLLAGPAEPPGPLLVAVGDLKQSIYRFRGADVSVFAGVVAALEAGGGRVLSLAENHRSVPGVLAFANALSARALRPAGPVARPYEVDFAPSDALVPRRTGGLSPACELLVDPLEDADAAERRLREARALAARIGAFVSGRAGVPVREKGPDGVERERTPRPGDVAILLRRLTQVSVYEQALREAGVPCRLARGGGFYQATEVRDLGELLAGLSDPADPIAWAALLRSPLCAVGDEALVRLARLGFPTLPRRGEAELAAAVPDGAERARLVRFLAAWRGLRAACDRVRPAELLTRAIDALDLDAALLAAPDGERRLRNVEKAVALAARFDREGATAGEVASFLRTMAARPPREPEADLEPGEAVAIVTVHQAKGLEWPIVFLPDLGGRPPGDRRRAALTRDGRLVVAHFDPDRGAWTPTASHEDARGEERRGASAEARRLLYVATTRARDYLVLSGEGAGRAEPTWRGLVDAALADAPAIARVLPFDEAATASVGPPLLPAEGAGGEERDEPPTLPPPAPAPATTRMAVTELAEYARCPRRHLLGHVLGREEPRGDRVGREDDDPARATARGTLAHALLAEVDLGAPPLERSAQLDAAVARRGYDARSPGVRRIVREVLRFADSPAWRELAAVGRRGALRRELPFLLRLGATYLVGAIDLLAVDPAARAVTVVDYKYAVARPGAVERYRFQLLAYALAAARAHPGFAVRARLQFLRGDARAVDVTPTPGELERFAAEAPALAAAARAEGERDVAALGRTPARCRAEGCGWASHCHGPSTPGMTLPAGAPIP